MTKTQFARIHGKDRIPIRIKMKTGVGEPPREIEAMLVIPQVPESIQDGVAVYGHSPPENRYRVLVRQVERDLGTSGSTTASVLDRYMKERLGDRFLGVFAAGHPVEVSASRPYAIVNTKPAPGEHWLAVAWRRGGSTMVYDSFGRDIRMMVDGKLKHVGTERDAEQAAEEENCGQRCCAWLLLFDELGPRAAKKI